ncbi:MAG: YdeI/OmpD-associated family protein [Candidatus Dormiibacterota bacterium]
MKVELPELTVFDVVAWRRWLVKHSHDQPGVWLVLAKRDTSNPTSLTYGQALDEALCHGWIDGQVRRRDQLTYCQRFTPRLARSQWSQNNIQNIARLTSEGRMQPAGLSAVARAQGDGSWEAAYAPQSAMEIPADLATALQLAPRAQEMFEILTSLNRYAVLYRINQAKRLETRSRRIEQFVAMLERGETVHPQRRARRD